MTGTDQAVEPPVRDPGELPAAEEPKPEPEPERSEPSAGEEPEPERGEPAAAGEPGHGEWKRHSNGRWIVGDAGNQPAVVAVPAVLGRRRPDVVLDGGRVGALDYRAVSMRGLSHLETGKPRQDSYVVSTTRDERWLVGCVADGVSDGKWSHRAADLACSEVVGELVEGLAAGHDPLELNWGAVVASANVAIKTEFLRKLRSSRHEDREIDEDRITNAAVRENMSSTAVGFVVATRPDPDGTHRAVVTVAAGDSSALLLRDGEWSPLTEVKGAGEETASSAVRPLPREVTPEPVGVRLRRGDAIAVITDGIGDPMGAGRGVVGRFFAEQWRRPPDPIEFAHQVGFYRRTFMDDRTAAVVWVAPEPR